MVAIVNYDSLINNKILLWLVNNTLELINISLSLVRLLFHLF
jgi:hypothetical protein